MAGAIIGTVLAVGYVALFVYFIVKVEKTNDSEDELNYF
jgi:hypothetical protein